MSGEEKKQAATVLYDELRNIGENLKRARLVMNYITSDYFRKYSRSNKEDGPCIQWDFDRNGVLAEIVEDYLWFIETALSDIQGEG